jgi:molybdopterin-guanine dinucleotide biosynthesis protein A/8-oxo-dGTP pyrophosphatase MutT (NUDIX family)
MGQDKSTLVVGGATLAKTAADALVGVVHPVIEVGPGVSGLPSVREDPPSSGPLVAVAAGFLALGALDAAVVLACDLPFVDAGVVRWLAEYPSEGSVVPVVAGQPQPLCARWSAPALVHAADLVGRGERAMRALLQYDDVVLVDPPRPGQLQDLDTPEDLARVLGFEFGEPLKEHLAANLARHERLAVPLDGRRHAAVAVVVVDSDAARHGDDPDPFRRDEMHDIPGVDGRDLSGSVAGTAGGPAVLLTRRAAGLRAHARQWALPGGRIDEGERPVDTALRELQEELGLALDESAVLGMLDDYPTRSGYVITPFVLWGGADPDLHPHPGEVRSVHRVAFTELCRPDSPRFVRIAESPRPVVQIPIGGDLIHAPTGAVLLQFRRVAIEGTLERVAEYEQPVFAWR